MQTAAANPKKQGATAHGDFQIRNASRRLFLTNGTRSLIKGHEYVSLSDRSSRTSFGEIETGLGEAGLKENR